MPCFDMFVFGFRFKCQTVLLVATLDFKSQYLILYHLYKNMFHASIFSAKPNIFVLFFMLDIFDRLLFNASFEEKTNVTYFNVHKTE